MTDTEIGLPTGWEKPPRGDRRDDALCEYQYEGGEETTFLVSVFPRTADSVGYELRLSVITRNANHVRHDYYIEAYDSRDAALDETEAFLEHVTRRISDGTLSSADPEIDDVREVADEFSNGRVFPTIRRLLARLR